MGSGFDMRRSYSVQMKTAKWDCLGHRDEEIGEKLLPSTPPNGTPRKGSGVSTIHWAAVTSIGLTIFISALLLSLSVSRFYEPIQFTRSSNGIPSQSISSRLDLAPQHVDIKQVVPSAESSTEPILSPGRFGEESADVNESAVPTSGDDDGESKSTADEVTSEEPSKEVAEEDNSNARESSRPDAMTEEGEASSTDKSEDSEEKEKVDAAESSEGDSESESESKGDEGEATETETEGVRQASYDDPVHIFVSTDEKDMRPIAVVINSTLMNTK